MRSPAYRISHLYKILIKGDGEDDSDPGLVATFSPKRAQRRLIASFWHRNIILKARQLGMTTFIAIMFLDACLFRSNVRAGMIAQTDPIAKKLFRDKVKFAYDNLPDHVRRAMPLERESADELLFAHTGSSIQVSTSMRSGTLQYLHVSEFGKICADFPRRAQEVVTGSIPTVPANGVIFIESTAEGREGHFYNMTMRAKALQEQGTPLTRKDYKLHFFPWFEEPNYRAPAGTVLMCHPGGAPAAGDAPDPIATARQWEWAHLAGPAFAAQCATAGVERVRGRALYPARF